MVYKMSVEKLSGKGQWKNQAEK